MAFGTGRGLKGSGGSKKGTPLGPRCTVSIGKVKVGKVEKQLYSQPLKSVAEFFGMQITDEAVAKSKTGVEYYINGVKSNSIKIPTTTHEAASKAGKPISYRSFPIPQGMTIKEIKAFLAKAITKNKPDHFVSPNGRTHSLKTK